MSSLQNNRIANQHYSVLLESIPLESFFCLERDSKSRTLSSRNLHFDSSACSLVCNWVTSSSVLDIQSSCSVQSLISFLIFYIAVVIPSHLDENYVFMELMAASTVLVPIRHADSSGASGVFSVLPRAWKSVSLGCFDGLLFFPSNFPTLVFTRSTPNLWALFCSEQERFGQISSYMSSVKHVLLCGCHNHKSPASDKLSQRLFP